MAQSTEDIRRFLPDTYILLSVMTVSALAVLYVLFVLPLNHIPGPFLAMFTDLWRLFSVLTRRAEKQQRHMHDTLGPAVRLGPNMVSISDPAMINTIYSRNNLLLKSDFYAVNDLNLNGRRVHNIFSTRDEHYNTKVIKPIIKLFSMSHLLKMEALVDNTILLFMKRLDEDFASTGNTCDMAAWLHYCAADVISDITFGKRLGFLEQGIDIQGMCKIGYNAMDYFSVVGMMPWLDLLLDKNPVKRIGPPVFAPLVNFALKRIEERCSGTENRDETPTVDFLDGFLEAKKQFPDSVTDDTVLAYLIANVAAGSDAVAIELRSILYHLCKDKATMNRLQAELDHANAQVPISWAQTQTMPYLCACVEEGIRLMPGISLPLERVVGKDGMTLCDQRTVLPPGTKVGINPWVVNRDRAAFGEDPHGFHPERWLIAKGESDNDYQKRITRMHSSNLTFGAGKRQCAGRNLALLECHKIIGTLVRTFDIELADPSKDWTTINSWFIRQKDMDMVFKKRIL
ncbi:MAG: hypothetical protein M1820_000505 [Bogoriella megaspora]|nr:MAG: hypothetical protein M1820_000505 [Bogoriella megaspora]